MDFNFTKAEEEFRKEVQEFIRKNPPESFPVEWKDMGYGLGDGSVEFTKLLGKKGWLSMTWAHEYGGQGRGVTYRFILMEELAYHRAPQALHFLSLSVALSILRHGTLEQKKFFLPGIGKGDFIFCTGFSEPDAGSDLFSIRTNARKDGDHYIINGQKVWTTQAHLSNWMLLLAKTGDENGGKNLSTFLVDMNSPGISIRTIPNIASAEDFSEIFLDDVRVPDKNLLGEENRGLPMVFEALEEDRFWARAVRAAATKRDFEDLGTYLRETRCIENNRVRNLLVDLAIEIEACRLLTYKVLWLLSRDIKLTHEASVVKAFADQLGQTFANVALECVGARGSLKSNSKWSVMGGRLALLYAVSPSYTIAGGTTEIQKLTIALRGLGMPRV